MHTTLPGVVAGYFEADARHDIDAFLALFTEDAEVVDEGRTHHGTAEIRAWKQDAASRYQYTVEVLGAEALGENAVLVAGRLTGDFPGGVAELKWRFTLDGDRVHRLEIAP
ncbi:hypothetical protein Sme01_34410 [Sphaerisporangium melleum]|uniref:SnoaL-like domain-containing protein n=1 Tax=Sphaerisporangium melleum TaxID=321316 RepID=A0A917VGW9_9ACTN|nr:nuclear transport factor 2 family protein [Sphaerisporangium melleum]GGK74837.1 hypothetical protein GCM10007964_17090 [Sphaerisporangium melleum]GII70965.1 hypothetical protein Sme01_34410 [Sphaerisporangium melleum]